ncbi:MAG: succinylglutamate desuccinylase/aspartoacylase family protein [Armatimonadetes bacterium]|nr:succinylglutamate desuccinylase/aspartoacylase family protein [Armatimonadota bacterium]
MSGAGRVEWIPVCTLASGAPLRLAVHCVDGARDGPSLGVVTALHGDEIVGIEIVRRVVERVDPRALRGRLRLVPVANPLAFETLTRNTPLQVEGGNLNRVFPGTAGGDPAHLMAQALAEHYLPQITHLVDIHNGGTHPIVDYCISLGDLAMTRAFGQTVIKDMGEMGRSYTLAGTAIQQGRPAMIVEVGGGYFRDEHYAQMGARGVFNVMKHLGMVDGTPELPARQHVVDEVASIRPRHGGLLYPAIPVETLGQRIAGGTLLGRVVSPYTFEVLEELRTPFADGIVVLLRPAVSRVNPGDYAFMVADLEGARILEN